MIRPSIRLKLFLVLLCTAGAVVAGMYAIMQWSFERGFIALVESQQREKVAGVLERLAEEYRNAEGWERLRTDPARWIAILLGDRIRTGDRLPRWARRRLEGPPGEWPPRRGRREPASPHDRRAQPREDPDDRRGRPLELRLMLLDENRSLLIGRAEDVGRLQLEAVVVQGRRVGWLGLLPGPALSDLAEIEFVESQQRTFLAIAIAMVLVAGGLGVPLAGSMTRRLRRITEATRALAEGRYDTRVPIGSRDELGELGRDVNDLATALERTEHSRRQWIADISHELRTPIAVLRAELEALQDGVRRLDGAAVSSLHADSLRLERLVDDLYTLARSDLGALSYRKRDLDAEEVLAEVLVEMRDDFSEQGIQTSFQRAPETRLRVHADADRLTQLFRNLLTNSLRCTDPGGRLEVRAGRADDHLLIEIEDSAPGVPAAELEKLFERFYRVESSRSRAHGGSGLGLAICRSIVDAHDGRVQARASRLGGLAIRLELPLA